VPPPPPPPSGGQPGGGQSGIVGDATPPPPPPADPEPVTVTGDEPETELAASTTAADDPSWRFRLVRADALLDPVPPVVVSNRPDRFWPAYRPLTAVALEDVAAWLVIPLFVGRPDPALAQPPADLPSVAGR
jgi:hypothetical protein